MTLVSLLLGFSLVPNVTYETRAARIPVILEQLQPLTNQKLVADAAFTNEVMVISVTDVKSSDLLAKIARASTGVWEKDKDRLILKPDLKRRAEQEKERMALRVKRIHDMLGRLKKELDIPYSGETPKRPTSTIVDAEQSARRAVTFRQTPISRLAMRLLIAIGADRLAKIERGDRVTFAMNANAVQAPWPSRGNAALVDFRNEWVKRESTNYQRNGDLPELGGNVHVGEGQTLTPDMAFTSSWISVQDLLGSDLSRSVDVGVIVKDGGGFTGSPDLYLPSQPTPPIEVRPDTSPIVLDEETIEFSKFIPVFANPGRPVLDPKGKHTAKLLAPDFEPLSIYSELYLQFAKARNVDLVSLVNDNSLATMLSQTKNQTMEGFERLWRGIADFEEGNGWLVTLPSQPTDARRSRDDRKWIRRMIADAADGHLDLETRCEYFVQRPFSSAIGLGYRLAQSFDAELGDVFNRYQEASARVYGALSKEQRKGGDFPIATLSPAARAALAWGVIGTTTLPTALMESPQVRSLAGQALDGRFMQQPVDITYVIPGGIPAGSLLRVEAPNISLGVRPSYSDNRNAFFSGYMIESIAEQIFFDQNPTLDETRSNGNKPPDRFTALRQTKISMRLAMGERSSLFTLNDSSPISKAVPHEGLPDEIKAAVQAELAKLNKMKADGHPPRRLNHLPGQTRSTPPP